MPTNLLSQELGISKSLLNKINTSPDKVMSGVSYIGSDGEVHIGTYVPPAENRLQITGLLWNNYTGDQSFDVDCRHIPNWNTLNNGNFILGIIWCNDGRTDYTNNSESQSSSCTYTGINYNNSGYNASTGFYHVQVQANWQYQDIGEFSANSMIHFVGNEHNMKSVVHMMYGISLTAVYVV